METRRYRPLRRRILGEFLEPRCLLSAVGFVAHELVRPNDASRPTSVYATDLDGDGDMDVLSASLGQKIAWYENRDGKGAFGEGQVITTESSHVDFVHGDDFDGDGDIDVLVGYRDGIAWYENTDGKGKFGDRTVISPELSAASVNTADLDGDGDVDVLAGAVWYENTDGKGTFHAQVIDTVHHLYCCVKTQSVDVDGDSDLDVLSVYHIGIFDGEIAWNENLDGNGSFGVPQVIATQIDAPGAPIYSAAADLDSDGDVDVLFSKLVWYENADGNGGYGGEQVIGVLAGVGWTVALLASDVDGNGNADVLVASFDTIAWYENTDAKGSFGPPHVVTVLADIPTSVHVADLDSDGDVDVLVASRDDRISWYENRLVGDADDDGEVSFDDFLALSANFGQTVDAVWEDGDFDGDGAVGFADFLLLSDNFGD